MDELLLRLQRAVYREISQKRGTEVALYDAIIRAEAAESALVERDKRCVWTYKRYGGWFTTCQVRPASHSVSWKFCPYCGHPIEVAE